MTWIAQNRKGTLVGGMHMNVLGNKREDFVSEHFDIPIFILPQSKKSSLSFILVLFRTRLECDIIASTHASHATTGCQHRLLAYRVHGAKAVERPGCKKRSAVSY